MGVDPDETEADRAFERDRDFHREEERRERAMYDVTQRPLKTGHIAITSRGLELGGFFGATDRGRLIAAVDGDGAPAGPDAWRPGVVHNRDASDPDTQRRLDDLEVQGERNEVENILNAAGVPRSTSDNRRVLTMTERVRVLASWAKVRR